MRGGVSKWAAVGSFSLVAEAMTVAAALRVHALKLCCVGIVLNSQPRRIYASPISVESALRAGLLHAYDPSTPPRDPSDTRVVVRTQRAGSTSVLVKRARY